MFNLADAWGWHPAGTNPARGIQRIRVQKHERFLTREEIARLGAALVAAPSERLASADTAALPRASIGAKRGRCSLPRSTAGPDHSASR